MANTELIWIDAMCGIGSFHQSFQAIARLLARARLQSPTTPRWTCALAFYINADLATAYHLNYPTTPWACANITSFSEWPPIAVAAHLV